MLHLYWLGEKLKKSIATQKVFYDHGRKSKGPVRSTGSLESTVRIDRKIFRQGIFRTAHDEDVERFENRQKTKKTRKKKLKW